MHDVTAFGELLIDFSTVSVDEGGYPTMAAHPGGAPCNFLAALAKYGKDTVFMGKVGGDAFGGLLRESLEQAGIGTQGLVSDGSVFTTLAFVTLDSTGDRSFSFARKPGADTCFRPEELDLSFIDESRVFHFGTLSLTDEPVRSATRRAVAYAREKGKLISFDPNLRKPLWDSMERAREEILWGLGQADVVKISDEEVDFLWGCSPEEGADRLLEEFPIRLAMVTLGARGALLKNRTACCTVTPPGVKPVDTTGAGDIFGGSAMARLLELDRSPELLNAEELKWVGQYASTAASLSTTRYGGLTSVPDRDEVLGYLE